MYHRLWMLLICALVVSGAALAQEDLTETYVSEDGTMSISHPEDWAVVEQDGAFIQVGTSAEALQAIQGGDPLDEDEVGVGVSFPNSMVDSGLDPESDPEDLLETVLSLFDVEGDIEAFDDASVPAARVFVETDDLVDGEALFFALQFDAATLLVIGLAGDNLENSRDIIEAIVVTIEFGDAEQEEDSQEGDEIRQWASDADGSSEYGEDSWSFEQATGEPDTFDCGDISSAWASATSTGEDFLVLTFDEAVIPTEINIYQTYNPGSIVSVAVFNTEDTDAFTELDDSEDPPGNTDCPGVFSIEINDIDTPVDGVIIYLDQTVGGSWNEIDAVELVGVSAETEDEDSLDGDVDSFTSDDTGISFEFPADWVVSEDIVIFIASDEEVLEALVDDNEPPADGEVILTIVPPTLYSNFDLDEDASAEEVMEGIIEQNNGDPDDLESYDELDNPAFISTLGDQQVEGGVTLITIQLEEVAILVGVQVGGDFEDFEDEIIPILNSFSYDAP